MIDFVFTRNGQKNCTTVKAEISTDLSIELSVLPFTFETGKQYAAVLLRNYLNEELKRTIEAAHENGYTQGWQDAKSKKRRKTCFDDTFRKIGEDVAY